eukprot:scaffold100708_cov37-Tisochrysis_lutea.AAC.3
MNLQAKAWTGFETPCARLQYHQYLRATMHQLVYTLHRTSSGFALDAELRMMSITNQITRSSAWFLHSRTWGHERALRRHSIHGDAHRGHTGHKHRRCVQSDRRPQNWIRIKRTVAASVGGQVHISGGGAVVYIIVAWMGEEKREVSVAGDNTVNVLDD